jgi:hypothetical protein
MEENVPPAPSMATFLPQLEVKDNNVLAWKGEINGERGGGSLRSCNEYWPKQSMGKIKYIPYSLSIHIHPIHLHKRKE